MNVVECHFEFGGFDHRLIKGGISVYLWNLCQALARRGVAVTGLTAAHGTLPMLRTDYSVADLDYVDELTLRVPLDPWIWPDFGSHVEIPMCITAHRITVASIEVVVLAGGLLDSHPVSFYPPYEIKGRDVSFLKPLVFEVAATRYLRHTMLPDTVVHLHEPYYHYLMPQPLRLAGAEVVCSVQSNMPVNKKVYGPEVRALLDLLGGDPSVTNGLTDPPLDSRLERAMRAYLPRTHLYSEYPERPGHDYLSGLALVARTASALDFLSLGQLEHVVTQGDTPAEALFEHFAVYRELRSAASRLVVGGCAIGESWRTVDRSTIDGREVLARWELDPGLPTIYHNARYAIHHKGQRELAKALRELLDEGLRFNAALHCLSQVPLEDPELVPLTEAYPEQVRLKTDLLPEEDLVELACVAQLCLFPSKFEMDTFLLAMGEAMACGAVPVATAQRGMEHFDHTLPLDDPRATGIAVSRSFRADDRTLVDALKHALRTMLALLAEQPARFDRLRANTIAKGRSFTWEQVAGNFQNIFAGVRKGTLTADPVRLLRRGWGDLLTDAELAEVREQAMEQALRVGDVDLYIRLRPLDSAAATKLFDAAQAHGDVQACQRIARLANLPVLAEQIAARGGVTPRPDGWWVRYRLAAPVCYVEVVCQGEDGYSVWPLAPDSGAFTGTVPAGVTPSVALLVTLVSGRAVWDELEVDIV